VPERVTAGHLATVLHDHCHVLLSRVLRVLGEERTITLLVEALHLESNGGLCLKDRGRRRTLCGTFLQLVKEQASPEEKRTIFR
jgi:hypothetical protein